MKTRTKQLLGLGVLAGLLALVVRSAKATPAPKPTTAITSVKTPASGAAGDWMQVEVTWEITQRGYIALSLMMPPEFNNYVSSTSTEIRNPGEYTDILRIPIRTDNAIGLNVLRVSLDAETGQTLAEKKQTVEVTSFWES